MILNSKDTGTAVLEILRAHLGSDSYCGHADRSVAIMPSSSLVDDLGFDSLDMIEIVMSLEEEFNIELTDDALDVRNVAQLIDEVDAHRSKVAA